MKKRLLLSSLAAMTTTLAAANLVVDRGIVQAHTEVFGDSHIDPATRGIVSHLKMKDTVESIEGSVDVSVLKLKSDNHSRDEHMVKALESEKYPISTYTFKHIAKHGNRYEIDGILYFHGVKRPLRIDADIVDKGDRVVFRGKSALRLSAFRIKPIKLLFLEVRDKIDLNIDVTFDKK